MNIKGEITTGAVLVGFIGILVALILMQGSFPFIGAATNTYTLTNRTFTGGAGGVQIDLVGQELLSTPIVSNKTGQQVAGAGNYTIAEGISRVDGLKRIIYTPAGNGYLNSTAVNISYDYGQEGYVDDTAGRSVAGLIPIMAALAIVVFSIAMVLKEKFF